MEPRPVCIRAQIFLGKDVTVNRQNSRNWDTFLQHVTDNVRSTEAVRELCTPTGGTRITCYDDLVDREAYVAVGRGKFRDIGYVRKLSNPLQ